MRERYFQIILVITALTIGLIGYQNCGGYSGESSGGSAASSTSASSSGPLVRTLVGGDMYLERSVSSSGQTVRNAATGFEAYQTVPWPSGVVPVAFSPTLSQARQVAFLTGCAAWAQVANVACIGRTTETNYLYVNDDPGTRCATDVGAGSQGGVRTFSFAYDWCWTFQRGMIHELGHVLGFMHEHQRADRDAYLDVHVENIDAANVFALDLLPFGVRDIARPYDFQSVMHYHKLSYSGNGQPIFTVKPAYASQDVYIGNTWGDYRLSAGDVSSAVNLYGAPGSTILPVTLLNAAVFDPQWYLQNHADLLTAFGAGNYNAASQHWLDFGSGEGRQGNAKFNSVQYLSMYSDVANAYGSTNYRAALQHYVNYGLAEGRLGLAAPAATPQPTPQPTPQSTPQPTPQPAQGNNQQSVPMMRFYNSRTKLHFYSSSAAEAANAGFSVESTIFKFVGGSGQPGTLAIYRCLSRSFFISSDARCEGATRMDAAAYGSLYVVAGSGAQTPVYRLYNSTTGDRLLTTDSKEGTNLGYVMEGIVGFAL